MYGRQGSSTAGDRRDRHHNRGKSTHSTRERGRKNRESTGKDNDTHGSNVGESRGGGGRRVERGESGRRGGERGEAGRGGERSEAGRRGGRGEVERGGERDEAGRGGERGSGRGEERGEADREEKRGGGSGREGERGGGRGRGEERGEADREEKRGGGSGREGERGGGRGRGEERGEADREEKRGGGREGERGGGRGRGEERGEADREEKRGGGSGREGERGGGSGREGERGGGQDAEGGHGIERGNEFILHEKLSPAAVNFSNSSSSSMGGFEIYMPVSSSSSNNESNDDGTLGEQWGSIIELRTKTPNDQPSKVQLWQKDWRPGPLTCTIPRTRDPPATTSLFPEEMARVLSSLDHPHDRQGNNLVLHCIDLQHYIQDVADLLAALPDDQDRDQSLTVALPDKPTKFYKPGSKKSVAQSNPLFLPDKLPPVHLDKHGLSQLLRKSTAAICSFTGYEYSSPDAHNTLSDVLANFLSDFTRLIHMNADQSSRRKDCLGFQDPMERSLHQIGMGGKDGICQYWEREVRGQARLLDMEADELRSSYLRATIPEERTRGSSTVPRLSSPFSSSGPFSSIQSDAPMDQDMVEEEEEFPLDENLHRQTTAQEAGSEPLGASYSPLNSPELRSPDMEGLIPLLIDVPPRKRLRMSSLEQE